MGLASRFISRQLRRPSGRFGRHVMTRLLNKGNRSLIDATLRELDLRADTSFLDVGFGGGAALELAARTVTDAPLWGADFSPDVVQYGQQRLGALIGEGRLNLVTADVGALPFRDGLFDRIATMNTVYFWPEPRVAAQELGRVLGDGGWLAVGYTGADKMAEYTHLSEGFTHVRPPEVEALLFGAGLADIRTVELHQGRSRGDFVTLGRGVD